MADENKPAFYPRVGNIKARDFKPAQPMPIIEDPRAMDLPQYGDIDFSVPSKENLEMARRMAQREADLRRQREADRSPLEKLAGGMQAGRFLGSAMTQAINSAPTRLFKGDEAADKFMEERLYKPEQPLAYEYAGDIGDFLEKLETEYKIPPLMPEALPLQFLTGPATAQAARAAGKGAVKAGMALERSMEPVVRGALERGGLPREMAMAMGANTQSNVVKPSGKGANWLDGKRGSVEAQLGKMKMADYTTPEQMAEMQKSIDTAKRILGDDPEVQRAVGQMGNELSTAKRNNAINSWIDSNLRNYVKNQMATPDDPVRKLAEEGILHMAPYGEQGVVSSRLMNKRMGLGQDPLGMGRSDPARFWERMSDISVDAYPAGSYKHGSLDESLLADNPWLQKIPDETMIYSGKGLGGDLGFDHILDVLREDVAAGRIRPEQLSKVSMEQAVRRTAEYDQELAKKMNESRATARADLPVYKDYPEGYKWVELNKPGSFANESEAMGHSVRGYEPPKGHPDWTEGSGDSGSSGYGHGGWEAIKSGKAKVYSLVDPKGEPHATVEVGPTHRDRGFFGDQRPTGDDYYSQQNKYVAGQRDGTISDNLTFAEWWRSTQGIPEPEALPPRITQIKGKQNRAPKAEYLPYIQDFVKGGTYSEVGDLQNTGLYKLDKDFLGNAASNLPRGERSGMFLPHEREELILKAMEAKLLPERGYVTEQEYEDAFKAVAPPPTPGPTMELLREMGGLPPEGMKRGGVAISNNPDTMMLAVNNVKMQAGGLAKLLRAVPKSKAEIEAIAQRMAPQMLGEFVRGDAGTQSVAGKTQKQFAKEKEMVHDIRPTGAQRPLPKTVDIEDMKDQVMIGIAGDPTISGQTLHSLNGIPLDSPSPQHGGPLYGLGRDEEFWASGLGAANRVQNLAREAGKQYDMPVLGKYIMMGPESINYAQHYADANLSAIDLNKMNRAQVEAFNNLVREGYPYIKNKERYQRVFPAFPGIENPSEAYLHFSIDPELRKHFNALMQMPTVTEKYALPSGVDVRHAITEPDLRDLETGVTGKSIGRMRPEVTNLKLSEHPTYSHDIPGEFMGSSQYPIPYELSFPDTVKAIRENPKQAPHEFGSLKMIGPRQVIDQQMIDEIKQYQEQIKRLTGKKKGGAIKKQVGGAIKSLAKAEGLAKLAKMREEMAPRAGAVKNLIARDENKYLSDVVPNSLTNAEIEAEIKRMAAKAPIIMKPSALTELKKVVQREGGDYGARRLERAADEIPNLDKLYKEEALKRAFTGDNAKALMTMNPADFENYAARLAERSVSEPKSFGDKMRLSTEDYLKYLNSVNQFDDVPFLVINKQEQGLPLTPFISGHEGRHRNRAMAQRGEQSGLVQLLPRAELREPFPRRSQEEYIDALRQEMEMTGNKVKPESYFDNSLPKNLYIERPAIDLPDFYAKGGAAKPKVKAVANGEVKMTKNRDTMFMELSNKKLKRK